MSRAPAAAVLVLALVAFAGVPVAAATRQTPAAERPAGPGVDFVVVTPDGAPVPDLTPADVEIRINDRVRVVRTLRRVTAAPDPKPAARVPAPYGTNESVVAGRRFAIVVDQESLTASHGQLVKNAVEGLVGTLTAADRVMVAALPFGGLLLPFTSDSARILGAIRSLAGHGSRTEDGSDLACRTRRFLEAFDALLRERADPHRSPMTVIVFTAGMAAPRRDAPMAMAPGMCELPVETFNQITSSASLARANLYILQPADIAMTGSITRESIGGLNHLGSDNALEGIENLAGVTRAARLPLDATGTAALLRVSRETSSYYEAELEPAKGEVPGRSRALDVRVKRPGVVVRARSHIVLFETAADSTPRVARTLSDLLAAVDPAVDLGLRAGGFTVRERDGLVRIGILIEPREATASLASAGAILIDASGRVAGRWFARDASEHPLLGAIAAAPGIYRLRVAATDSGGRAGVAETTVAAELVPVGPLSLGSLILGVSRPEGTRPQLEFGSEPAALASFDIYGGTAGLRLAAAVEVARDANGPALLSLPLALTRAGDDRVVATGAVPIGALPPGDYLVRGVVRLEDGTTGRVERTLRKVPR